MRLLREPRLRRHFAGVVILILLLAVTALAQSSSSCPPPASDDERQLLQTLLCEVRQLRRTIEKSNVLTLRVQLALEQLRAQQERVDKLSRQLDQTRRDIDDLELATLQANERIKVIKKDLEKGLPPPGRQELEAELQETQDAVTEHEAKSHQLRDTESSTANLLQGEQSKLENLRGRLADLEREISNPL
jgi:chromosome segregation ATPase